MTLNIELPDSLRGALEAQARARGVSAEQYAQDMLAHEIESGYSHQHISEVLAGSLLDVPPEVLAMLPKDGASQHDHYTYGLPKRNS